MDKIYFLHGLGQDHTVWGFTIERMQNLGEVICTKLFREGTEHISFDQVYQEFQKNVAMHEDKINLCGLSLGAVLALQYGIEHPEKVNAAVLIAGQYKMPRGLLTMQSILFRLMPDSSFRETGLSKRGMIHLTESMKHLDFSDDLRKITFPVLVLCGENDRANRKASLELAEKIPNAELRFIKDAGHEVNKDAPEELARVLDEFFSAR